MSVIANLAARMVLNAEQYFSGMRRVEKSLDEIKKATKPMKEVMEAVGGAGALAGIGIAARMFEQMTGKVLELTTAFREGKITAAELPAEIAKSIPIIGDVVKGAENIAKAIEVAFFPVAKSPFGEEQLKTFGDIDKKLRSIADSAKLSAAAQEDRGVLQAEMQRRDILKEIGEYQRKAASEAERIAGDQLQRRAEEIVNAAKLTRERELAAKAAKDAADAAKKAADEQAAADKRAADAADQKRKSIQGILDDLRRRGESPEEAARARVAAAGGSVAEQDEAGRLVAAAKKADDLAKRQQHFADIAKSARSPMAQLLDTIDDLQSGLAEGAISWTDYARAVGMAVSASGAFNDQPPTAIEAGTTSAARLMNTGDTPANRFLEGIMKNSDKQVSLLRDLVDAEDDFLG